MRTDSLERIRATVEELRAKHPGMAPQAYVTAAVHLEWMLYGNIVVEQERPLYGRSPLTGGRS